MKTTARISRLGFTVLLISVIGFSCSNNSDDATPVNSASSVVNIVNNGSWHITYYFDTDHEETAAYTGYNFVFGSGNSLTASNGTNTYTGSWSVTDSDSDDDELNDLDFNIGFLSPAQFAELTDDWEIIERSATVIKLRDVSGGGGGTDLLTFTKN